MKPPVILSLYTLFAVYQQLICTKSCSFYHLELTELQVCSDNTTFQPELIYKCNQEKLASNKHCKYLQHESKAAQHGHATQDAINGLQPHYMRGGHC